MFLLYWDVCVDRICGMKICIGLIGRGLSLMVLKRDLSPDSLKCANVRPIYKKEGPFDKKNDRPVSISPLLSEVYERVKYEQVPNNFEPFFNEILCGFRKAHSTHILYLNYLLHGKSW